MVQVIPDAGGWASPVVPRDTLNSTQSRIQQVQLSVCATDQPLRFGWGRQRLGALWLKPIATPSYLYLPFVVARGPIDAVETVELGNGDAPTGVTFQTYVGTASPSVDPWLSAAYSAHGYTYSDTLSGIAWGVMRVADTATSIPTDLTVTARLALVYDPRLDSTNGGSGSQRLATPSTWAWSQNPVLALADFLRSTDYGRGESVDWASVATCASIAEETVGSGTRRTAFGLTIDTVQGVQAIEDTLRAYAGVWVVREDGVARLVPDAPASSVFAFSTSTGNYLADSIRLEQRKRRDLPTVVSVVWTDTTVSPWAPRTHVEYASGVLTGTTPWREEAVQLPGIQNVSWAKREALRRLNQYITSDLTVTLIGVGDALQLRRGDVVTVTDTEGLSSKLFRLTGHAPRELGLWSETLVEYDAAIYSDAVADAPTSADTTFPLPTAPPTPTGLALAEELFQLRDGSWRSRIRATWTAATWPFLLSYQVRVWSGGAIAWSALLDRYAATYATGIVQDGETYQVDVAIVSTVGAVGTPASATKVAAGKLLPPTWPSGAALTGFEAGGKIYLRWTAAQDIDVYRYELRYGPTSGSFAAATIVNRLDALAYVAEGLPAGTWRFYVEAYDSVGGVTGSPLTRDIVVTLDAGSFLAQQHTFSSPTTSNMTTLTARDGGKTYVTDFGDGLGYGADNTNDSVGTFGDSLVNTPFAHPHTAGTSSLTTESWDVGYSVTANFTFEPVYTDLSGTASVVVQTSPDNSTWTDWAGGSGRTTARYVRGKISTTGTMLVQGSPTARIDVVPRTETGTVSCSSSGATTVTLGNKYATAKAIQLTPTGTASRTAVYDNVIVSPTSTNSFDVYVFNGAGTQVTGDVSWVFQGV